MRKKHKNQNKVKVTDAVQSELQTPEEVPTPDIQDEPTDEVNAPGSTVNEDEGKPVVQPLESIPESVPVHDHERCWNCYAQDKKTRNFLDEDGICAECGFEKDLLYNGNIEADKAAQRMELARAAERGE